MRSPIVTTPAIAVSGLRKVFARTRRAALDGLDLSVERGEFVGIVGRNGAGKTTLFGCLLGLLRPTRGTIEIDGRTPEDLEVRRTTGYLPERFDFDRWMTGRQFLAFHQSLVAPRAVDRSRDVEATLERVGLDPVSWDVSIRKYSRGMLQRLALAQALIGRPRYLFLDEPSSGLDPPGPGARTEGRTHHQGGQRWRPSCRCTGPK
jgi:ABC-2 type transport system ATP-binding protein